MSSAYDWFGIVHHLRHLLGNYSGMLLSDVHRILFSASRHSCLSFAFLAALGLHVKTAQCVVHPAPHARSLGLDYALSFTRGLRIERFAAQVCAALDSQITAPCEAIVALVLEGWDADVLNRGSMSDPHASFPCPDVHLPRDSDRALDDTDQVVQSMSAEASLVFNGCSMHRLAGHCMAS